MPDVPSLLDRHGQPMRNVVAPRIRQRSSLSGSDAAGIFPYDAASWWTKETEGWMPNVYSPDYEIDYYRDRMVGRARDLVRNDGWASGGITRILDSVIGAHYRLSAMPDYRALSYIDPAFDATWAHEFRHAVEARWRNWAHDPSRYCDATQQLNFTQAMRLALRHKLIDGEDLVVMEWQPENIGYGAAQYATCFHLVDPDRLSNPLEMIDTKRLRGGVEVTEAGVPVAYHIRRAHQYDWYATVESMTWDRVERVKEWGRPQVIHDYDRERTDQHRGVSAFVPVINRMKMLTRYDGAELQAAVINAILSIAIKSPMDPEGLKAALDDGKDSDPSWYWDTRSMYNRSNPIVFNDAQVMNLFPGEDVTPITQQRPGQHHDPFTNYCLRNIAAQLGTTAEQLTQDFSKANYSSIRASIIEARKTIMRRRGEFGENTATPIYAAWLEEAMEADDLPLPNNAPDFAEARAAYARCRWIGPGQGWVDPVKERQGAVLGMDAGFSTLQNECAEQGLDWEENLDQRAIEVKRFKELGLPPPDWAGMENAHEAAKKPLPE
jgi:lambda family phage portal protein